MINQDITLLKSGTVVYSRNYHIGVVVEDYKKGCVILVKILWIISPSGNFEFIFEPITFPNVFILDKSSKYFQECKNLYDRLKNVHVDYIPFDFNRKLISSGYIISGIRNMVSVEKLYLELFNHNKNKTVSILENLIKDKRFNFYY